MGTSLGALSVSKLLPMSPDLTVTYVSRPDRLRPNRAIETDAMPAWLNLPR
jgi:hypothetical protein